MSSVNFSSIAHDVDILLAFYAGQYNTVCVTLEGWRTTIRAEVEAEYDDSAAEDGRR